MARAAMLRSSFVAFDKFIKAGEGCVDAMYEFQVAQERANGQKRCRLRVLTQ